MARAKSPPRAPDPPAVPSQWDRYLATEQAICRSPIELVEDLRARTIRRGDGSAGPMTFAEIAEIINLLAAKHAEQHDITPVVVSHEAVRRWWRHLRPGQPVRESTRTRAQRLGDAVTLAELDAADPTTAAQVRAELGL